MTTVTQDPVVTGPSFRQVPASEVFVNVDGTSGAQRLGAALKAQQQGGGGGNPGLEGIIQNGGAAIVANQQLDFDIQSDCTLESVVMLADQVGSVIVDVWRCTFAQFNDSTHPVSADKITGSSPPTISGAVKFSDNVLSGWTTALHKGDVLRFNVTSASTIVRLTVSLRFVVPIPTPGGSIVTENGATVKLSQMPDITATSATKLAALSEGGTNAVVDVSSVLALASGAVTQIIAGANVTISPVGGTGAVTINSSGSGGGGVPANGRIKQKLGNSATNTPVWYDDIINASNPAFGNIFTDARAAIQACWDYCYANGIRQSLVPINNTNFDFYNITGPLFNDPPNNLRNGITLANQKLGVTATPSTFPVGLECIIEYGSTFFPTNNADGSGGVWQTAPLYWHGTIGSGRLKGFKFQGPRNSLGIGVRAMDTRCTAIAVAAGNGGATDSIFEDCAGFDVYNGFTTGQNGQDPLAENNRLYNCTLTGAVGIDFRNSQALVNMVIGGSISGQLFTFTNFGQGIIIIGGEHGAFSIGGGISVNMTTTGTLTGFADTLPGGRTFTNYHFDLVMGSGTFAANPDGSFFYNAGYINLPNYPYTPVEQTAWNAGTSTATYKLNLGWLFHNFGEELALTGTTFATELAAATAIKLVPRGWLSQGRTHFIHSHVESGACIGFYKARGNNSHGVFEDFESFNWHIYLANDNITSEMNLIFPFIEQGSGDIILQNMEGTADGEINSLPYLFQTFDNPGDRATRFIMKNSRGYTNTNVRYVGRNVSGSGGTERGPCYPDPTKSYPCIGTKAFGGNVEWDTSEFNVMDANTLPDRALFGTNGTAQTPFFGTRPAPYTVPRLTQGDLANVIAKTSSPFIFGNQTYKVEGGGQTRQFFTDNGAFGSTDYTSGTIDWNCVAGSVFVNITSNNANARRYLYPGRRIVLSLGGTPTTFIVDGTWLTLATGLPLAAMNFISVKLASTSASVIPGTPGTAYSGATITSPDPVISSPGEAIEARVKTSNFNTPTDGSLANVTGLSHTVFAGQTYPFRAVLYTTSNVAAGVQAAIAGTATATAIAYEAVTYQGGVATATGTQRASALATKVGDVTAVTTAKIEIDGLITVNATGTLTVQLGQNAANGAATVALIGSSFEIKEAA